MSASNEPNWISELHKLCETGHISVNTVRAARLAVLECKELKARVAELEAQVADYAVMYEPFKAMVSDVSDAGEAK